MVFKMFFGLIELSFSDFITLFVLLIILISVIEINLNPPVTLRAKTAISSRTAFINGSLQKQKSDQHNASDDQPNSPGSPVSISPPSSARNSLNNSLNASFEDEYHEDEDTLSLENLFPCDQSEIYASKKISFIIDELIQTEVNYVNNLKKGLKNYGKINENDTLPTTLKGLEKQKQLLGNIDQVLDLHEKQILPMMLRNQRDLKQLFDEFSAHFEKDSFYCYVTFTMNKKNSMQLRQENREWFQKYQDEINDKLGIDSFLVQPIQRLTRYPLLLQQFISEFYKSGIRCKPVLTSVCKLETKTRRLLEVVNQAEEIPTIEDIAELDITQQGRFRKATDFDAYHYRSRKKYRAKVFLFDRCLVCVEIRKRRLSYKQSYPWEVLEIQLNSSKNVTILQRTEKGTKEEYEFSAPEAVSVTQWIRCSRSIIEKSEVAAIYYGKFTLPMDLVIGIVTGIWLMYQYLWSPKLHILL